MGKRRRGQFGRLFGRDETVEVDDSVEMSGNDDHAWWADRASLSGAPATAASTSWAHPPPDPTGEETEPDPWSVEGLFAGVPVDGTGPPPPVDDGATTAVIATEIDEARLVLGVDHHADWPAIRQAHRKLALQFHPDRLGDLSPDAQALGESRMAEINQAYETLRAHAGA